MKTLISFLSLCFVTNLFASTTITEINFSDLSSTSLSALFKKGADIYGHDACSSSRLKENNAKAFAINNKSKKSHKAILEEIVLLNTDESVIVDNERHYPLTLQLQLYSTFVTDLETVTDTCNDVIADFLSDLRLIKSHTISVYPFKTLNYKGFFVYKSDKKEALLFF